MNHLQAQTRLKELAGQFAAKGNGNAMTTTELKAWNSEFDECHEVIEAHAKALRFGGSGGAAGDDGAPPAGVGGSFASAKADSGQRLTFAKTAAALATKMLGSDGLRSKALAPSGSAVVGQEFRPDPVALGKPAHSLLDLLPVSPHDTAEFSYLRQTVRTNNAAAVPDYQLKPTSVYSVERIEDKLEVIAHLSEPVPRHWFIDNEALTGFLANELDFGLRVAVESKVLTDVNATSGLQTVDYATSSLVTLRKSLTKLETAGYEPGFFLLDPVDWEGIELLLASSGATDVQGIPYDPAARRLFGVPVVVSVAQATGVGHTVAKGAVALDTGSEGTGVQWPESHADDFGKNLVRARCEGRDATSVYAPLGVVTSDLTA